MEISIRDPFVISQLLSGMAFLLGVLAFQFKARSNILRIWCLSSMANALHFYTLGIYGAALLVLIASIRFLVASYTTKIFILSFFLVINLALLIVNFSQDIGVLAYIASSLSTIASFQKNILLVRSLLAVVSSLWIVHNLYIFSPIATGMEFFFMMSNAVGYWRYRKETLKVNDSN